MSARRPAKRRGHRGSDVGVASVTAAWLALMGGCAEPPGGGPGASQDRAAVTDSVRLPEVPDSTFVGTWLGEAATKGAARRFTLALLGSGAASLRSEPLDGEKPVVEMGGWQPTGDGRARVVFSTRNGAAVKDTIVLAWNGEHLVAAAYDTLSWGMTGVTLTKTAADH